MFFLGSGLGWVHELDSNRIGLAYFWCRWIVTKRIRLGHDEDEMHRPGEVAISYAWSGHYSLSWTIFWPYRGLVRRFGAHYNQEVRFGSAVKRWWGQEYPCVKKLDDLMPINVTVTNSGKITLPEIIKMLLFTLAASRLNSKDCLFSLGLSRRIHAAYWSRIKLKIVWL